ncbi:SusC/RagA family TonB-linked outer membrane protein [Parabacteroides pacaensis]|uniref:SusC/RagA family TonB-linked outer membrane protein n=1 Tax=Parabacteroides pacaensis TaxID=2086575 RepID=UPI001F48E0BB|nr:TonB-dependent receptor [Parabacteroides pacaensis]
MMKKINVKTIQHFIPYLVWISLIITIPVQSTFAQEDKGKKGIVVSGTVVDEAGITLPSVNIYLKDRPGVGFVSDVDGNFTINGSKNDIVIFSFMGYENYEYVLTKDVKDLKIQMKPSSIVLEEAVVVGMGTQRKVSVVGAITSVDVGELQVPATSMNNILGGRVPGVIAVQNSGEPGKNIADFWIRGIGTFGANSGALVLIDGLEGNLSQIDPADIESFSILKDASATAVYGVRGANGVVLVTTKRGEEQKLRITGRANFTVSYLNKMPEYLDAYEYAKLANEASVVSGQAPRYTEREMEIIKNNLDPDIYPNVNWQDEILNRTSLQQTYYLSARGGGTIARYFISLGMSKESAAYKQDKTSKYKTNVGYNTYNYRSNLDVNVTKTTSVYLGLDGYISVNNMPGMANTDWLWSSQAKLTPLTVPTRYSNGLFPAYGQEDEISPYILLNHTGMSSKSEYKNMVTLAVNQDFSFITPGLKLKIQGALDNRSYVTEKREKMMDLYNAMGRNAKGELIMVKKVNAYDTKYSSSEQQWRKYHFEGTLNYERVFAKDHRTSALLYYYMSSEGYTGQTTSMAAIPKRYQGVSSRLTYGYKDTYMIDVNFGYTGSENFRKGEQFGFFPAIALGWIPTNYQWVKDKLPALSYLKFRASYGTVGNDRISDDRFPYLTIINTNAAGGWGGSGLIETVVGADNLAWEKSTKADVGMEAKFLDDRLEFVVDVFNDKRDGIFQKRTQLPNYVGAMQMPYSNVGSMKSYGSDGNISYSQSFGKDFSLTVRGNFTYSNNKVLHWEQPFQKYDYLSYTDKPYNVSRGFIALGLFKDEQDVKNSATQFGKVRPGDIKYKDVTGDGKITDDDRVPLSYSPIPRLMYGFGGEFRYKNVTLGLLFKGTGKTNFFLNNNGYGYIPFYDGALGNVLSIAGKQENRWTPASYSGDPATENPNARFPRLSYGHNENNSKLSSFWLADSRYLRLQEVTLSYNFKHKALRDYLGISSLDLQLIGYNLAVWDSVKLWDPELANSNGYAYPIPMRFAFQLYVNF